MGRPCSPIPLRIMGSLGVFVSALGLAGGIANVMNRHAAVHLTILIPTSVYFLAMSIGTIVLNRFAAVLLVAPIAAVGMFGIGRVLIEGPLAAIALNLILVAPFVIAPAIVVYRNWSCLR